MFPPRYISCDYCCYLRVPFHRLASPPGFHVAHTPKGNVVYIYIQSTAAAAAAASYLVCCYTALLQLLPAAVRRVPDGENYFAGSLNLIRFVSLHSNPFMYPLAVLQLCRIYGLDLPTSSVIAGMRGAKAVVSPPRRGPAGI